MRLNLIIQVYCGGVYWQEAWRSVQSCLDCFENVYVSINYSDIQEQDIAVLAGADPSKVHWICHENYMTAKEHGIKIYQWLVSLQLQGHLLLLCHDDLLLRDGIEELLSLPDNESDAVFGSFVFFDEGSKSRSIGVRQFSLASGEPWNNVTFARFLFDNRCMISVSGIVLSVTAYTKNMPRIFALKHGCGSEILLMINSDVKQIRQSRSPSVKIRLRSGSEGHMAEQFPFRMVYDYLFFCLHSFVLIPDPQTRISIARTFAVVIREHPWHALLTVFPAMHSILKKNWCPLQITAIFLYLVQICAVRGYDFLLRKTGLDCR